MLSGAKARWRARGWGVSAQIPFLLTAQWGARHAPIDRSDGRRAWEVGRGGRHQTAGRERRRRVALPWPRVFGDGRALMGAGAKEDAVKSQGEGSAVPLRGRGRGFWTSDGGRAKPGRTSPNVGARAVSYVRCRRGLRRRGRGRGAMPERAEGGRHKTEAGGLTVAVFGEGRSARCASP